MGYSNGRGDILDFTPSLNANSLNYHLLAVDDIKLYNHHHAFFH